MKSTFRKLTIVAAARNDINITYRPIRLITVA